MKIHIPVSRDVPYVEQVGGISEISELVKFSSQTSPSPCGIFAWLLNGRRGCVHKVIGQP